jgi:glutaconate CoA-transferase subunit A
MVIVMSKLVSITEAVARISDGDMLGLGGNALNRAPMALVFEIARRRKRALRLVTTAGAMDVDLLCLAGCAASVDAAFLSYETELGQANHYRRAVQDGLVLANEHACYTLISGFRAAAAGLPFMPVYGLKTSDLLSFCDYFKTVKDPFSGVEIAVVKAYAPDFSLLHADEADEMGNARIIGAKYDDVLMSRAAKKVIVSAERIVPTSKFRLGATADIPGFLVDAVVHAPGGAAPGSCTPAYETDGKALRSFINLKDASGLSDWMDDFCAARSRKGRREHGNG